MGNKYGVLDLGSNSFHLKIVEFSGKKKYLALKFA